MTIKGTVVNGAIVPDNGCELREGERYYLEPVDDFDPTTLPKDHPMAPFDPAYELAILRDSIDDGDPGIPYRQAFEELSRKHGLGPLPPE